jgi:hypothetical protein
MRIRREPRISAEPPDPRKSSPGLTALVVLGGLLLVTCVIAAPIALLLRLSREQAPTLAEALSGELAPLGSADAGVVLDLSLPPPGPTAEELREAMRRRYRPGPFATLESLVPSTSTMAQAQPASAFSGGGPETPWVVAGGEYRRMRVPPASGGPALAHGVHETQSRPIPLLPGVPDDVQFAVLDGRGPEIRGVLVEFTGYPGSFYVQAEQQTELGAVLGEGARDLTVNFGIRAPLLPGGLTLATSPFQTMMTVATIDRDGRVGPPITRALEILPVGAGQIEVTLHMSEPTDLDLYVDDPSGGTIYYANRDTPSSGHLDLDANAACGSNVGVDTEHIYFASGMAPAGKYAVRVAHYMSCIDGRPVDYRLTIRNCGELAVLTGRFEGGGRQEQCLSSPGSDRVFCQDVVTFDAAPCEQRPVK